MRAEPDLCALCQEINLEDLKSDQGYLHHATCDALVQSAHTCHLCKSIMNLFIRSIHTNRRVTHPMRSICDCGHLGPVALHAACPDINSNGRHYQEHTPGPVLSRKLSLQVAVTIGSIKDRISYGTMYPTLLIFCDPSSFLR
ncbi:uncharacterized protein BCR38DRAFT_348796 [Pseudomassariella vexata]|uniref:Uncharacterized protein n=1 Tax=Pseudomassariella vexata TaxID=1141098 RepID=A0A1Y2DNZ9_9PEZI|nr:uncharacterized protein BCR38DRAFT_348796 [Pseudomassariella vexata]ORY60937.1 hypothetical protein BCR38DRAFT_348796 [Pseudomassariella vexata]